MSARPSSVYAEDFSIDRAPSPPYCLSMRATACAWNVEIHMDGSSVPAWIELIPAGTVVGRDGRAWTNSAPDDIVRAAQDSGKDIVVDWEHATDQRATAGLEAPAAGWVKEIQARQGAIWGRVEWTPRAADQIARKEYRYISPTFWYDKLTGAILSLSSVALTNCPNLRLPALNRQQAPAKHVHTEVPMKRLLEALGLKPEVTEDDAVQAVRTLQGDLVAAKAANREQAPSLDKYVPRADYEAMQARAANAERTLSEREKAQAEAAIEAAVADAVKAGKITPATVEYHKAQCRTEGGLDRFNAFVAAAPALTAESGLDGKRPPAAGTVKALNAEQKQVCAALGLSEEQYLQSVEVN